MLPPMIAMKHKPRFAAFTLIEVMVVLGIITLLVTMAAPHISGVLAASRLRTAAEDVYNRLQEAESLAILFNTDAEIRFYEVPDLIDPSSRRTIRKLRILTVSAPTDETVSPDQDVFEPVGAITTLEHDVEISPDANYSSIVDLGFQEATDSHGCYIAVRFRPDGSAALQSGKQWFLTLHEKDAHVRDARLKNFITLQIEPATGRLNTFQP